MIMKYEPLTIQRFFAKVLKTDNCWIWTGAKYYKGYGHIRVNGKLIHSHRMSYELFKGEIPMSYVIDHLCRNPSCVNPDHLEAVTNRQNVLRGNSFCANEARQTHCKNGHEFTFANTKRTKLGRNCRTCAKEWRRRYSRMPEVKEKRKRYEQRKRLMRTI